MPERRGEQGESGGEGREGGEEIRREGKGGEVSGRQEGEERKWRVGEKSKWSGVIQGSMDRHISGEDTL